MEEILLAIIQFVFELFGELILQVVVQFGVELFVRLISSLFGRDTFSKAAPAQASPPAGQSPQTGPASRAHPAAVFVLYATLGGVIGYISLLARPEHFIRTVGHRWLNLLITPLIAGGAMATLGSWHNKRGDRVVGMDKFFNGWGFALVFAVVRYWWCR